MGTSVRPSEYILRKAWNLGRRMAYKERRIGIDLTGCFQYPSYELFRTTNRARLQNLPVMAIWEERLQFLVRRAVNGAGYSIDNPRHWDAIEQVLTRPIRNAFWAGWEQAMDLEGLYLDVVRTHKAEHHPSTLHVNPHVEESSPAVTPRDAMNTPDLPVTGSTQPRVSDNPRGAMRERPGMAPLYPDVEEENGLWHQVARVIFDDPAIGDNDAFWAATGTQIESDHTGDESLDNLPNVFGPIRTSPAPPDVEPEPAAEQSGRAPQPETPAANLRLSA